MTKVTITASAEGNANAEVPARATGVMAAARTGPEPQSAAPSDFTTRLNELIAKARAYSAEFVEPAHKTHSAADHAAMEAPPEEKAELDEVVEAAWQTWEDYCDVYRAMVEPILELTPSTPEQLLRQVDAYIDLMRAHWAKRNQAATPLGHLGEVEVDEIAEHMHASLKRIVGGEGNPTPLPFDAPRLDDGADLASEGTYDLKADPFDGAAISGRAAIRHAWAEARAMAIPQLLAAE